MLPFDYNPTKRRINLGGSSSASSSTSILTSVREQRAAREQAKREQDAACRIQSVWKAWRAWKDVQARLRAELEEQVNARGRIGSVETLRCLFLVGSDREALALWSQAFVNARGEVELLSTQSCVVLMSRIAVRLLQDVVREPGSEMASNHLFVLSILLSVKDAAMDVDSELDRKQAVSHILLYLLQHGFYASLGKSIEGIPITQKSNPNLSPLISLATLPFSSIPQTSPFYINALEGLFKNVLTIHLLPNRLPVQVLPALLSKIPLGNLYLLDSPANSIAQSLTLRRKLDLLANLSMFFTPHYPKFGVDSLASYLSFLARIMSSLPVGALDHPASSSTSSPSSSVPPPGSSSGIKVQVVSFFQEVDDNDEEAVEQVPNLDAKTQARLGKLLSTGHVEVLLGWVRKNLVVERAFVGFIACGCAIAPTQRPHLLTSLLALTDGTLIRSLWRTYVRGSALGREAIRETLFDSRNAVHWPPLVLLAELYGQALVTMGDDEFFGDASGNEGGRASAASRNLGSSSSTTQSSHRLGSAPTNNLNKGPTGLPNAEMGQGKNPLTLDEVAQLAKKLMNVVFVGYWVEERERGRGVVGSPYPLPTLLQRLTTCLVAIHARDSRRGFMPPDGWLVDMSSVPGGIEGGMKGFVEAAILEENHLAEDPDAPLDLAQGQTSTFSNARIPSSWGGRRSNGPSSSSNTPPSSSSKRRALASLTPCLGVLNNIPFAIPFEVRVSIFRHFVLGDMMRVQGGTGRDRYNAFFNKTRILVRRGRVAQDGFDRLSGADLKRPIEITFVDRFGQEEAGIDGGGVFKEFFTDLCKEVFDTDRGLWLENEKRELYPNPHGYATEPHSLAWYRFIGRILGKAMYEGILVDVAFAGFFLARWLGKQSFLDDLASLDPDLYKGLLFLKHYRGKMEDLALNFTVGVEELGETKTIDLIPNGSSTPVTHANKLEYITLVAHYKLKKQIKRQSEAFWEGVGELVEARWVRMFNQQELQILLGGVNSPIDLDDLRKHTNYGGLYDDDHPVVRAFWKVVNTFDQDQRRALLRFATSCSRPPLLGFKELNPNFSIRDAGTDPNRLPTASTCVNLLKLPLYPNERIMKEKILQSIYSGSGFDLS